MAQYNGGSTTLLGRDGPENVSGMHVSRNFFDVLGVKPALGRLFDQDDERGEASNSLVITYGYWQRQLGGDRGVLGRQFSVDGRLRTVIGVLPQDAQLVGAGFLGTQLDIVTVVEPSIYPRIELHAQHLFGAIARLKPRVTLEQARADLYCTDVQIAKEHADIAGWTASVFTLTDDFSQNTRQPQIILLAAAGLLLLITCINVANLLLVCGAARAREVASRMSLGASRARLVAQFVAESLVLALGEGVLGIALAEVALQVVRGVLPFRAIVRADDIRLDGTVVLFALVLSVACALGFGLLPALRSTAMGLGETLRAGGRSNTGDSRSHRVRRPPVVAMYLPIFDRVNAVQ